MSKTDESVNVYNLIVVILLAFGEAFHRGQAVAEISIVLGMLVWSLLVRYMVFSKSSFGGSR